MSFPMWIFDHAVHWSLFFFSFFFLLFFFFFSFCWTPILQISQLPDITRILLSPFTETFFIVKRILKYLLPYNVFYQKHFYQNIFTKTFLSKHFYQNIFIVKRISKYLSPYNCWTHLKSVTYSILYGYVKVYWMWCPRLFLFLILVKIMFYLTNLQPRHMIKQISFHFKRRNQGNMMRKVIT